jgi:hypothetical protein
MAVRHHAYAFDPATYLADVERMCGGDPARAPVLRASAEGVVRAAGSTQRELLDFLRYDDEWLREDPGEPLRAEWLALLLVPRLSALPSLSHREPHAYHALERALPAAGWAPQDASLLVRGEGLDTLPERLGTPALAGTFRRPWPYGGWLPSDEVARLRDALERVRPRLLRPGPPEVAALEPWLKGGTRGAEDILPGAFADAAEMLDAAITQGGGAVYLLFE